MLRNARFTIIHTKPIEIWDPPTIKRYYVIEMERIRLMISVPARLQLYTQATLNRSRHLIFKPTQRFIKNRLCDMLLNIEFLLGQFWWVR
jgi:hypothetical protein